ncbi:hypothetical protein M2164_002629 [Streptomyces sp. SAI-208]|uniref:hypothetical protein n=1 Tax=unclassified Streptomyces TaxID=2593676 RepID=UPI0024768D9E|nr:MULTISPECIES: hypothetical protein [unclassified Streptomyces]MDH6516172.1 hypothetical protein [Streptomyces sp. SAI-090]MDH6606994.1 hypothetical protein [Streptomyces sp. SAI-208]
MLALRLTRGARPAVQLRRLLVALASAGTGFLLLCTLGHAMSHPEDSSGSVLRLAWCLTPLAATVHFALAVARTDPGTRPRPGLAAIGLGPARLMAVTAATTALSCTLGSMLALLFFLHLRGDLTGMPFDGAAADFLAADASLPLPAALTLLGLVPVIASVTVGLVLRPRDDRPAAARREARSYGRFGAYGRTTAREPFGAYGRFRARRTAGEPAGDGTAETAHEPKPAGTPSARTGEDVSAAPPAGGADISAALPARDSRSEDLGPAVLPALGEAPKGLPWGIAVLAAGLAVEAYANRQGATAATPLPGGLAGAPSVLVGWLLTAVGLAVAGPGLTHLCGRLLQSTRPGALRLLAGRVLMAEAARIGRPLGIVCAVASGTYAMAGLYDATGPEVGPLTTLGLLLVTSCTIATLLTAAVEAKHARSDTTAALVRLGAPATMLRSAAALRAGALLALFGPLTLVVAELAALPLTS